MSTEDLKERFFDAAQEILATDGYGGLKLAAVCKRLKVTTGAFYHAFGSWNEFTSEFLLNWRRERTTLLADLARTAGDPIRQLETLRGATVELRHKSEAAIRVWAAVDAEVAAVQEQVDRERYDVVLDAMQRIVGKKEAPAYADWGLNVLVGFELSTGAQTPEDLEWQLSQVLVAAMARGEERRSARRRTA